jgi:hypothetical protein
LATSDPNSEVKYPEEVVLLAETPQELLGQRSVCNRFPYLVFCGADLGLKGFELFHELGDRFRLYVGPPAADIYKLSCVAHWVLRRSKSGPDDARGSWVLSVVISLTVVSGPRPPAVPA